MKKHIRRLLTLVLGGIFLTGACLMLGQLLQYRAADQDQAQARQVIEAARLNHQAQETVPATENAPVLSEIPPEEVIPQEPLDPEAEFLMELDLSPLQAVNVDVIGWLHIPGGDISHPLLRSQDNLDYLYHAWDGAQSNSGSIFLECKNRMNLLDFNTVIYGHHMHDGSFFAPLTSYKDQAHRDKYPYVYLVTGTDLRRYEIFSAYEGAVDSDTFRLYYPDQAARQAALDHFTASSILEPVAAPTTDDYILTLSTCTGDGSYGARWVVQAKLTGIWIR